MAKRLTAQTILNMRGNTSLFIDLANEYELSNIPTIRRWLRENKKNGPLTTKGALAIISKAINVPEAKLLEEVNNEVDKKRVPDHEPLGT